MRRALLAILAALVLACGGGGPKKADTVSASKAASIGVTPSSSSVARAARALSGPRLNAALLAVDDMPSGYAAEDTNSKKSNNDVCPGHDPSTEVREEEKTEVSFSKSLFGPFVFESIARYADADTAKRLIAAFKDATSCGQWTSTDSNGSTQSNSLGALSFDEFGDETFAARFSVTGTIPASGDLVIVRRGAYLILLGNVGVPTVNSDDTRAFVEKADRKLKDALA